MKRRKPENAMKEKFWEKVCGTYIEEFRMVRASRKKGPERQGGRFLDALIVRGPKIRPVKWRNLKAADVNGKDLLMVQAKSERLGMSLMGQAFFSRILMTNFMRKEKWKPYSLRCVILCKESDPKLEELCGYFGMQVVTPADVFNWAT